MVLISSRGLVLEFVERCTIDFLCVPLLSGNMVSRVEQSTAVQSVVNECLVDSSSFLIHILKSSTANSALSSIVACSVVAICQKNIEELFTTVTLTCSTFTESQ